MQTFLVLCTLALVAVCLASLLSYPAIRITKRSHWTTEDADHARRVEAFTQAQAGMKRGRR